MGMKKTSETNPFELQVGSIFQSHSTHECISNSIRVTILFSCFFSFSSILQRQWLLIFGSCSGFHYIIIDFLNGMDGRLTAYLMFNAKKNKKNHFISHLVHIADYYLKVSDALDPKLLIWPDFVFSFPTPYQYPFPERIITILIFFFSFLKKQQTI